MYDEADDGQDVPCNWITTWDVQAYLDWSGLRPMTELEYEKLCRGPLTPVPNEFAWGTAGIINSSGGPRYTIDNINLQNEGIATNFSTTVGNAYHGSSYHINYNAGPTRVGAFAANGSNSGRVTSGGSYYGIMELSGNLSEPTIGVYASLGYWLSFNGTHGNGALNAGGFTDAPTWPYTLATGGMMYRGGGWVNGYPALLVSNREFSANSYTTQRYEGVGCRGVRTAP